MTWEIFSLPRLQKMVKLISGNCALKQTNKNKQTKITEVCLENLLLKSGRSKCQRIHSHTHTQRLFEKIRYVPPRSPQSLNRSQLQMKLSRIELWESFLSNWVIYTGEPQSFWLFYINRNTVSLNWKVQRDYETKEGCWIPKILQAENRLIKQLRFKHVVPFMKNKGFYLVFLPPTYQINFDHLGSATPQLKNW